MKEELNKLREENAQLKARISELEALLEKALAALNKTSQTSDKPPSTDPPSAKTRRNQSKRRRKRGPKHGHKGSHLKLMPVEEVTELVECIPSSCKHCDHPLDGHDPSPQRHQVTELPPVKPLVTEYQLHKLQCSKCRKHTRAQLPEGADWSMFGPRLKATVCNLTGQYQLPKDSVVTLFKDLFGISISPGSVCRIERQAADLLEPHYEEAEQAIQNSKVVHMDETGWRINRAKSWMWGACADGVRLYAICDERGGVIAQEILEGFDGILNTDRYSAYNWYPIEKRQFCWAHLLRKFRAMSKRSGQTGVIGEKLSRWTKVLFKYWHKARDGTWTRKTWLSEMEGVQYEIECHRTPYMILWGHPT